MKALIDKMRADFTVVAADRKAEGEWSDDDIADIGAAIKAAIAANNTETIVLWARWLADLAAPTVALKAIIASVGSSMRKAAADRKQQAMRAEMSA